MDSFLQKLRVATLIDTLDRTMDPVEGYLPNHEGFLLYTLAREGEGLGAIVEIGSFAGRSTCYLALGSKQAGREKVYAVDTFQGSPEQQEGGFAEDKIIVEEGTTLPRFKKNIDRLGLGDWVTPICAESADAVKQWDQPIRLLFIDGDHTYEGCRQDFDLWSPFVSDCGSVIFHDYGHAEGVTRVCDELPQRCLQYRQIAVAGSMVFFRKQG